MSDEGNRHPVDELGWVRDEIRKLKIRERALREDVLELGYSERVGRAHKAIVKEQSRRVLDIERLRADLGAEELEEYYSEEKYNWVRVVPIRKGEF